MLNAHDPASRLTGRIRPANEEFELDGFGNATHQATVARPSTPTLGSTPREHRSNTRSASRKWLTLPSYDRHVPTKAARDHLANERVFLGYIRTASALANFAITALQLYRLQHHPVPQGKLSDYDLGIPVASATLIIAVAVAIAGVWRFFSCQNAMALRKQIVTSGIVVLVFIPAFILLLLALLIFTIIVDPNL
ncbi:hypothetical protein A1O7_02650 [Cladophialophora yegresii CBS 114405]|uniref:DUF202 domain-containing protein n=1 Tax=Cladophialophora yegresii CBS 114405 TaxID=1182544 RepID=W9W2C4_9EURO|nr:uncharacterized protein A1O7_02650 [Cladophialophora yegresii CBS 114405]EXJ62217.1 hypothetical protein A1O7_02650 [Cladophialophora yegresii CBS 114405]